MGARIKELVGKLADKVRQLLAPPTPMIPVPIRATRRPRR
jgi:hypothetical protein